MTAPASPELSRPLSIADIPSKGLRQRLEASPQECEALAARLGVRSVLSLTAMLEVKPWRSRGVSVSGTIEGRVEQECVVTLDPVVSDISEEFLDYFLPELPRRERTGEAEIVVDPLDENEPELLAGTSLDLGELVVEHAILAIDPYPRVEGAQAPASADAEAGEEDPGPFAVLAALRQDGEGG